MNASESVVGGDEPLVVLVDGTDREIGRLGRWEAHRAPGRLHRAVSLQAVDADGRWLVQRRATTKALFAGRWANTCCTHPFPGEAPVDAAARRVVDELGARAGPLVGVGDFVYRAPDPLGELVEHEFDHVVVARTIDEPAPNPAEVAEFRWCEPQEALSLVSGPLGTPWAPHVLELVARWLSLSD